MDRNANFEGFYWWVEVALRKESVDRNGLGICYYRDDVPSLSARRAWIEIFSVREVFANFEGRSPQGERG